eukprot:14765988-Alexandrium_andersonii.AAC.1
MNGGRASPQQHTEPQTTTRYPLMHHNRCAAQLWLRAAVSFRRVLRAARKRARAIFSNDGPAEMLTLPERPCATTCS